MTNQQREVCRAFLASLIDTDISTESLLERARQHLEITFPREEFDTSDVVEVLVNTKEFGFQRE